MEKLKSMNLSIHKHSDNLIKKNKIDIYLVDVYGATLNFYKIAQTVFLGGSLIPHGGQNPLEPARLGCKIFHGPNVSNFVEIYEYLKTLGVTKRINNSDELSLSLIEEFEENKVEKSNTKEEIDNYGQNILNNVIVELKKYI